MRVRGVVIAARRDRQWRFSVTVVKKTLISLMVGVMSRYSRDVTSAARFDGNFYDQRFNSVIIRKVFADEMVGSITRVQTSGCFNMVD